GEAAIRVDGPYSQLCQQGVRLHAQVGQCCGNRVVADLVGHFVEVENHPLWVLANELALHNPEGQQEQVNEHRAILEALEAGEAGEAARKMSVHLQRLSRYLFGRSPGELSPRGTRVAGPVSRKAGEL